MPAREHARLLDFYLRDLFLAYLEILLPIQFPNGFDAFILRQFLSNLA